MAQATESTSTRRAFVRGVVAATAVIPSIGVIANDNPIFALSSKITELRSRYVVAHEAQDRHDRAFIEWLKTNPKPSMRRVFVNLDGGDPNRDYNAAMADHSAAMALYKTRKQAARQQLTAADMRCEHVLNELDAAAEKLAATKPETLAGLKAKATSAEWYDTLDNVVLNSLLDDIISLSVA